MVTYLQPNKIFQDWTASLTSTVRLQITYQKSRFHRQEGGSLDSHTMETAQQSWGKHKGGGVYPGS